ncbi:MAG: VWA domain-containing protein [Anaerolineae bacterium]|nr:VWA domain-containing protein [Anaerolineae bacterium]
MLNRVMYENSGSEGHPVLEIIPAEPRKTERQFVPLKRTTLQGSVVGPLASLLLAQHFGFTRQQSDKVIEAVYRFPLPGDAAVVAVTVRFGEVEIRAALKERAQAEEEYEAAKREGQQAALATRESPDVFTLQVAGIQPDQDVVVETSYVQLARAEGQGWSVRIPLTTAPRYTRSDEYTARHAQGQPLWVMRDPGHRFALDLTLEGAAQVMSPTHALDVTPGDAGRRVRLREGEVIPDRDCVLVWTPTRDETHPTLQAWAYADEAAGYDYFLALAVPPARMGETDLKPREVILLVDRSGSMDGPKWAAAEWAVKQFLSGLRPQDVFTLGMFDNVAEWFLDKPGAAAPDRLQQAVKFLEERGPRGGTELGVALEQALRMGRVTGEYARHLLIVTDAQITDEGRVFRLASDEARRPDYRRISVLCIDAAPNSFTATEVADRGRGVARFLTSNPQEEDITTALDQVLADWSAPVQVGVRLEVNRSGLAPAQGVALPGGAPGWSALDLGDLPAERPVWAVARSPRAAGEMAVRLVTSAGRVLAHATPLPVQLGEQGAGLKALFGARRVLGLEYLMHAGFGGQDLRDQLERLGYRADDGLVTEGPPNVYAENQRAEAEKALRGLLVREALTYGLASAETAFIAVRREAGQMVEQTVVVANALPAGWSENFLGGPVRLAMASAPMASRSGGGPMFAKARRASSGLRSFVSGAVASQAAPDSAPPPPQPKLFAIFTGVPPMDQGQAVLFDSTRTEDKGKALPSGTLARLRVHFSGTAPTPDALAGLTLLLFVDDMTTPRARVRLADLVRQGGDRPLNVARGPQAAVRLTLVDEQGVWAKAAPPLTVELG